MRTVLAIAALAALGWTGEARADADETTYSVRVNITDV